LSLPTLTNCSFLDLSIHNPDESGSAEIQLNPFHRPYPGAPGSNQHQMRHFNMGNTGENKLLVKQKKQVWWKGPV